MSAVPNPSSHAPAGPWSIDLDSTSTISFDLPRDLVTLVRFGLAMVVAGLTAVCVAAVQHSREIRVAFPAISGASMRISLISALALTSGLAAQVAAQDTTAASKQPSAAAAPEAAAAAQPAAAPASGPGPSASLGLYVFPAKGQTPEQQKQDEQTCYAWAQEQSSIDPANVKANPDSAKKAAGAKADSATAGAGVKGAAKGAVGGAVIGGITGDAGEGAGVGAVVGVAKGRQAKKAAKKQAEQQAEQQTHAQAAATMDSFKKAYSACIEGKGYTVK